MFYDCYGRPASNKDFMSGVKLDAYEIVSIDSATYIRFSSKDFGAIQKIVEKSDGSIVVTWTIGSWANKESLAINVDLNTAIELVN